MNITAFFSNPATSGQRLHRCGLWPLALLAICIQAQAQPHGSAGPSAPVIQAKPVPAGLESVRGAGPFAPVIQVKPVAPTSPVVIDVYTNATADNPYRFKVTDFVFSDTDGDALEKVVISTAPPLGTLRVGNRVIPFSQSSAANEDVARANIGTITWYPEPGQAAQTNYTTFLYTVFAGGEESSNSGNIRFDLVERPQTAASGAPTVAATGSGTAYNEDVQLTASTTGITEPNGINASTLQWRWYRAPAPATGDPAAADYAAISGATAATFTPLQAHVGMYIRVCAFFTDSHSTPASEGGTASAPTLCSTGTIIADVNHAPASADASVNAPVGATAAAPFSFSADSFAFEDEDQGDSLASITITTIPALGALRTGTGASATTLANGATVMASAISTLNWHPPANATAASNYTNFQFTVSDGTASSSGNTMTINLVEHLRLRLRLFLEGPLR